jgi:hypothetical protein
MKGGNRREEVFTRGMNEEELRALKLALIRAIEEIDAALSRFEQEEHDTVTARQRAGGGGSAGRMQEAVGRRRWPIQNRKSAMRK